jgi:hypothetical protein
MLLDRLFRLILVISFLFNNLSSTVDVAPSNLFVPAALENINLVHNGDRFTVVKQGEEFPVKYECMDKELRSLSDEDLVSLLGLHAKIKIDGKELFFMSVSPEVGQRLMAESEEQVSFSEEKLRTIISQLPVSRYIRIFQYSDGEYGLHLETRLPGGGGLGAVVGCITGKFVVHAIGGVIAGTAGLGATIVAGPVVGWAVAAGTWGVLAPTIEAASTVAAVAAGITLGAATGPV